METALIGWLAEGWEGPPLFWDTETVPRAGVAVDGQKVVFWAEKTVGGRLGMGRAAPARDEWLVVAEWRFPVATRIERVSLGLVRLAGRLDDADFERAGLVFDFGRCSQPAPVTEDGTRILSLEWELMVTAA